MIHHSGHIEVICGSMFCGKTEELIRRIRRAIIARQTVQVFKPDIDDRYAIERVTSHTGATIDAQPVKLSSEIITLLASDTTVVAVDEAQFLDVGLIEIAEQ
ncbi:MAG: thymidine kinase, partial [Anaerolineae bacterium]|nr:thymidine kinase [Anaerolineae bacterium]